MPSPIEVTVRLHAKPQTPQPRPLDFTAAGRLPQLTRVLALAVHFEHMIATGEAEGYADVARLTCLCRERVSQIVRLTYLAPEIQVEILYLPPCPAGRYPISEVAARKIANLLCWTEQRRAWSQLKQFHRL